jgi:hypothetical protein
MISSGRGNSVRSLLASGVLWLTACQLTPAPILVTCPLPAAEQAARLQTLVPLGTPRGDVLRILKENGIAGDFGENESLFYCDVWDHGDGERWHINVTLLFDEQGLLYATRPDPVASTSPDQPIRTVIREDDPFE